MAAAFKAEHVAINLLMVKIESHQANLDHDRRLLDKKIKHKNRKEAEGKLQPPLQFTPTLAPSPRPGATAWAHQPTLSPWAE